MVNKVLLIGRVGQEPEFKQLESGAKVATFSLATNEVFRDKQGEKHEVTDWHNVVVWNRLAEIVEQYVRKGDQVFIEGKVRTRSYETKEGDKRYITEIFANSLKMRKKRESARDKAYSEQLEANPDFQPKEDDLPF